MAAKTIPQGHMLDVVAISIPRENYVGFRMSLLALLDKAGAEIMFDQSSGDNLDADVAIDAFARYVRERG